MSKELRTQWHPAIYSAIRLELKDDSAYLDYIREYNLNTKPLEIDILILKKRKEIEIQNEIGKIFRTHNIVEDKSPDDALGVDTFLKVHAYACLYKANEPHVDEILFDEITLTFIRERKPKKLLQWFSDNGYEVEEKYEGIFYVRREHDFPIQIVVTKLLSKANQKWLTLLSSNLSKEDVKRVAVQIGSLVGKDEREYADSVLQVVMKENKELFSRIKKEDDKMCEALREFFEPELREARESGIREGMERGMERGLKSGIERGLQSGRKEMILNALKKGSSAELISSVMGIPLEKVQAVEKEAL